MSIFSDILNELIREKEVKIFSMAKYCGLDRSTMYKIISGKRNPPSPDLFEKMTAFMRLTPSEYQRLAEAWKIARIGSETYFSRKSVDNFIRNFPSSLPAPSTAGFAFQRMDGVQEGTRPCIPLTSQQHIDCLIHQMLLKEAGKQNGQICLLLQADHDFLFSLLASLKPAGTLNIRHILCFSDKLQFTSENKLYNLTCLEKIFPLYMIPELEYNTCYFYDEIHSHFYNFNLFPYMLLTTDAALLCSSDYSAGMYFQDPDAVHMLRQIYNSCYDQCTRLFEAFPIVPDRCAEFLDTVFGLAGEKEPMIGIQPEACLTPFISGGILKEIFNHSLPGGREILTHAENYFRLNSQKIADGRFFIYFTYNGLAHFAQTGLLDEIPEVFYHPLSSAQRISVLEKLLDCCRNRTYRILREPLNYLPRNLHLCVCSDQGNILFKNNSGDVIVLTVRETGLIDAFRDYMENMDDSCFYDSREAEEMIREIIRNIG